MLSGRRRCTRISKKPFLVECVEWVQEAVRHSHTCQGNLRVSSLGPSYKVEEDSSREKCSANLFFKHALKHMGVLPRTALELTVAIFPWIARWNRFERIPVLGDPTLFNAEEVNGPPVGTPPQT